jgi:ABC-type antimicrobial peptide transport system permease subunit
MPGEPARVVIGIVPEIMQYSGQTARPQIYVPYGQLPAVSDEAFSAQLRNVTFIVRTARSAPEISPEISDAVARVDRMQAISSIRTMHQTAFAGPQRRGVFISLIGLFGIIAVALAVVGVYGVMANIVNQRFHEFGIRMALGADPWQIRRLVIRYGGLIIVIGLTVGLAISLALTRVLQSFLFGASATDPLMLIAGVLLLGGVALLACYIPARRASRIDVGEVFCRRAL